MPLCRAFPMSDRHFRVTWEIDAFADTPEAAARYARRIQTKPGTTATVFAVQAEGEAPVTVDLTELDEAAPAPALTKLYMRLVGGEADTDQVVSFNADRAHLLRLVEVCKVNGINEAVISLPDDAEFKDIRRFDGERPTDGFILDDDPDPNPLYDAFRMYAGEAEDVADGDDLDQLSLAYIHVDAEGMVCLEVGTHGNGGPYWTGRYPVESIPSPADN